MSSQPRDCLFSEGSITLPEAYQDRTVNVFTAPGADAPAFNISRDSLNEGELLTAYIDRQLGLMAQHLKGWKSAARGPAVLGDALIHGEVVHASYLRDGRRVWQQQAVFCTVTRQILVFTMSASTALTDADSAHFQTLLRSFRFHA